jgi:hypothetical protein
MIAAVADPHEINERARLISHCLYAEAIEREPGLLDEVYQCAKRLKGSARTSGEDRWLGLLETRDWTLIRQAMLDSGPEGRLLRSNSPFSIVIGIEDVAHRRRIWREAKAQLLDQGG